MSLSQLIQTEAYGEVVVLQICGGVSSLADHAVLDELDGIRQFRRETGLKKLIIDLEQAPFFGSSLLEVIRVLWNDISHEGGQIVFCSPSPVGRDVLEVAKFDRIWPVLDSRADAFEFLACSRGQGALPAELEILISRYEQGPKLLREAVSGLSPSLLNRPAAPGQWSILQNVCHIADFELVYADRLKRVIAENEPTLFGGDPDVFAERLAYSHRDLDEELDVISAVRRQVVRILMTLKPADFDRVGHHSADGPLSLKRLLERIAGHIPHHVRFIEQKKVSLLGE